MTSQPFGGHPTLAQYCVWAESEGCTTVQGVGLGDDGRPYSITKIISPDKKRWVIEAGTQHKEYLVPTTVERLDRRLGLKSPFFSLPEPDADPA